MPELPEVETIVGELRDTLVGRTVRAVTVLWPRTVGWPSLGEFQSQIAGRRATDVRRRGKYLVVVLDQGYLLIHLKMSGRLRVVPCTEPVDGYTHTLFDLDNGHQLRFRDVRKFGRVYLVSEPEQITGDLGPEPLSEDFVLEDFRRLLSRRSGRLKSLLLNQSFVAGLGNIYADESLFAAGLHPLRRADTLDVEEQRRLYEAIREVLGRAIAGRGTTLDDQGYVDIQGRSGSFQQEIAVYSRAGQACPRCSTAVERIILGGRSTHFCPQCQR
jgi:formamidopyrimidine-DNA glycosylase